MPHIPLPNDPPGIRGLLLFKPATGTRIAELIHQLLRGESPLSAADRERIAAHVSRVNECEFCTRSHTAAHCHLERQAMGAEPGATSPKLAALLRLAEAVVPGGHHVTDDNIAAARVAGNNDEEIHDAVLIAAAFCMLNRYVDGLAAITPDDDDAYDAMGARMAAHGYLRAAPDGL